ncbi:MAG TPA: hypothetical protein PKI66_02460 [Methanobacteriaceae archaeon]|jgi:hypothetical protein|nr:hypothetical protein [Euryarchaeota archaeon]HNR25559.1 hypothetical protein [Methanobacteriaceae archaeon]HNS24979.1 hypothetical protein [Methanobacteriaceae archaeon]
MKKEAINYLESYGNIIIYVIFIMGTVMVANLFNAWSGNTPQVIIIIMCLLVLFDIFRQSLVDPKKSKMLRNIILLILMGLVIITIFWFFFLK